MNKNKTLAQVTASLILFAGCLGAPLNAFGINLAYMPGDAFFYSRLTRELCAGMGNEPYIKLVYDYPIEYATFGGYAGFEVLRIEDREQKLAKRLQLLYAAMRKEMPMEVRIRFDDKGKEEQREINGFELFVYNSDANWQQQVVGLKYNEDWMNLPAEALTSKTRKLGFAAAAAHRYVTLLPTYEATREDWQYAKKYDALRVTVPKGIAWGVSGTEITEPVTIDAANIQVVVVAESSLKDLFKKKALDEFFMLDAKGTWRMEWVKKKLVQHPYPEEERDEDSETAF